MRQVVLYQQSDSTRRQTPGQPNDRSASDNIIDTSLFAATVRNFPQFASFLHTQFLERTPALEDEVLRQLIEAAQTKEIGLDGRLLPLRRGRRRQAWRRGLRGAGWYGPRGIETGPSDRHGAGRGCDGDRHGCLRRRDDGGQEVLDESSTRTAEVLTRDLIESYVQQECVEDQYCVLNERHVAEKLVRYQEGAAAEGRLWNI